MNKCSIIVGLLLYTCSIYAEEVYLEGISVLGNIKKAYVVMDEGQIPVEQGDELGQWVIEEIHQRAIVLSNARGETQVLELYSKLNVTPPSIDDVPIESIENTEALEILQKIPDGNPFAPRPQIDDADIPEGKRKVSTPFGDFLVDAIDADPEQTQLLQQADENMDAIFEQAVESANSDDAEIDMMTDNEYDKPIDETGEHPVIRTPFGDLPMNTVE